MRTLVLLLEVTFPDSDATPSPSPANMPLPVISFILYPEQGFLQIPGKNHISGQLLQSRKHPCTLQTCRNSTFEGIKPVNAPHKFKLLNKKQDLQYTCSKIETFKTYKITHKSSSLHSKLTLFNQNQIFSDQTSLSFCLSIK